MASERKLGIYIHIPFCAKKCRYCDFYSLEVQNMALYERYINALLGHMRSYESVREKYVTDTVFIGGGTPTLLPSDYIAKLLKEVRHSFHLIPSAEITMECNPATIDFQTLKKLRKLGVNRLSIGLQSANDSELAWLGRIHKRSDFEKTYLDARKAGFSNINVDVMYGIPHQTLASFRNTMQYVCSLKPDHVSMYSLKIEDGTPFSRMDRASLALPDENAEFEFYTQGISCLRASGIYQYEISNFARPGKQSRHNLKYWKNKEYLGFGPAAFSYFGDERFGYTRNIEAYVRANEDPNAEVNIIEERERIIPEEKLSEYIMLRLRLAEGIHLEEFYKIFGYDFEKENIKKLIPIYRSGLAEKVKGRLRLTPKGMFISNYLISELLPTEEQIKKSNLGIKLKFRLPK